MFFVLRRTKRNGCLHREIADWRKDVKHFPVSWIAVSTSSMVEKAIPISVAAVSIPIFAIRFNNERLKIERRNCCPSTNSTRPLHARITGRGFSCTSLWIGALTATMKVLIQKERSVWGHSVALTGYAETDPDYSERT